MFRIRLEWRGKNYLNLILLVSETYFYRSTWYKNQNFRGSYSYRSINTDLLNTTADHLAYPLTNPVGVPVLQFAGEATHEHYYSTVHGAVESGWREAKRITDFYKK